MAAASKIPEKYRLHLEISQEEAETLRFILRKVGGCPHKSPRTFTEAIEKSLEGAGVEIRQFEVHEKQDAIYFKDYA